MNLEPCLRPTYQAVSRRSSTYSACTSIHLVLTDASIRHSMLGKSNQQRCKVSTDSCGARVRGNQRPEDAVTIRSSYMAHWKQLPLTEVDTDRLYPPPINWTS